MANPKFYAIQGAPAGWLVREGVTYRGQIVVSLVNPDGEQVGTHYVGDDGHEFQMGARAVLGQPQAIQWLGGIREVGERLAPAEAQQSELRQLHNIIAGKIGERP